MDIPIGFDCGSAGALRKLNKRKTAYPFDWNIAELGSIYSVLENDCKDFLLEENLIKGIKTFDQKYENEAGNIVTLTPLFDKKYGILYVHDWAKGISPSKIKIKYERRFNKLIDDISNAEEITVWNDNADDVYKNKIWTRWVSFFDEDIIKYKNTDDISIFDIVNLLKKKFPNKRFKIRYSHKKSLR